MYMSSCGVGCPGVYRLKLKATGDKTKKVKGKTVAGAFVMFFKEQKEHVSDIG